METAKTSFMAELVDEAACLPSVAARIVALTSDPRCDMHELSRAILADGAMTMRFLALANSAAFSRGQEITDLRTALVRLGLRRVRDVALLMGAHDLFPRDAALAGLDATAFWRHGIATACWSRVLARRAGLSADDAWLAGILHGIGVAAMVRRAPDRLTTALAAARRGGLTLAAALEADCGCHHGELGVRILSRWNLPADLCDLLARHPEFLIAHRAAEPVAVSYVTDEIPKTGIAETVQAHLVLLQFVTTEDYQPLQLKRSQQNLYQRPP